MLRALQTKLPLLPEDHPSHALNTHPTLRRNHLEPLGNRKDWSTASGLGASIQADESTVVWMLIFVHS